MLLIVQPWLMAGMVEVGPAPMTATPHAFLKSIAPTNVKIEVPVVIDPVVGGSTCGIEELHPPAGM